MSGNVVLSVVGAAIGFAVGGPTGAAYGWSIGSAVGSVFFPPKGPNLQGPRLQDLRVQNSAYGQNIARVKGKARLSGNVIWASNLIETAHTEESGGKGGGGGSSSTTYTYAGNFAVAFCEGEICDVQKIWANGKLIYNTSPENILAGGSTGESPNIRIYLGTEDQMPDDLIESYVGAANTPAYRGLVYIVFQNLELEKYGNQLPSITIEALGPVRDLFTPEALQDGDGIHLDSLAYVVSRDELWVTSYDTNRIIRYDRETGNQVGLIGTGSDLFQPINYDPDGYVWGFYTNKLVKFDVAALTQTEYTISGIEAFWLMPNGDLWVRTASTTIKKINKTTGAVSGTTTSAAYVFDLTRDNSGYLWYTTGGDKYLHRLSEAGADTAYLQTQTYNCSFVAFDTERERLWVGEGNYVGSLHRMLTDGTTKEATIAVSPSGPSTANVLKIDYGYDVMYVVNNYYFNFGTGSNRIFVIDLDTNEILKEIVTIDSFHGDTGIAKYVQHPVVIDDRKSIAWIQGYYSDLYYANGLCGEGFKPVSQIISEECELVGLSADDIDVTDISTVVRGYILSRRATVRANLEPLAFAFNFDCVESDWRLKFVERGGSSVRTIEADDLAVHDDSADEFPADVVSVREHDLELPVRIDINYLRKESDYQVSTQSATRQTVVSDNQVSLEWPMVLSDSQALHAAQTQMADRWLARNVAKFSATRKHADIEPADIVSVPIGGEYREVLIKRKEESRAGQVNFEAVFYDSSIYTGSGTGDGGLDNAQEGAAITSDTVGVLLDLPALLDTDSTAGFYWSIGPATDDDWSGATLFKSQDNGTSYYEKASQSDAATIGTASTLLGIGRTDIFDEANTLIVVLTSGSLSSSTREAVLNGSNACALRSGSTWEVFQFLTAELIATDTYKLSGLLRGRKGTEDAVSGHAIGDDFVFIGFGAGVRRVSGELAELNKARLYKHVTFGQAAADVTSESFTNTGRALKPYAPVALGGGRNAAGDLTLNWKRRTRIGGDWSDNTEVPLGEESELYEVEIWNSGFTTLKRTISGLSSETTTYTAAQQTTDFGGTQSTVYVRVYQISATVGRGFKLQGSI